MAGTPLTATKRYIRPGVTQILWVPSGGISNIKAPTRAELDAGTDLTGDVADYAGFELASDFVDTPDLGSRFISQITGQIKPPNSQITFWADDASADVRTLLPQNTTGYIVVFPEGDGKAPGATVKGTLMDVWPVKVGSEAMTGKATDPGQRIVAFATTDEPAINVTIPT
ncbi:hypothetical protein AAW14_06545 [Streptomyces hygroscopicus]|uniref:phage tail tube protein n=1 Tax=Streptomyces hygroscopicus TaxID=1912 RepID=UPI00223F8D4B|nr:hypothetical protein [Streptomyces hygroscopicus]MCW7941696.1 hypothetical protein [Streptomyces hygroscopicus]